MKITFALALNDAGVVELWQAKRPILKDGQSVVGFVEDHYGLYLAVTQSGATLAPPLWAHSLRLRSSIRVLSSC